MISANFSSRLKELMDNSTPKTTQQDLAQILNVTRQQISNYATGKTSPDPNTICTLAKYFHVSTDYLLGVSDIPQSDADIAKMNKSLGLSEKVISFLQWQMSALYELTNKETPSDAFAEYERLQESFQTDVDFEKLNRARELGFIVNERTIPIILSRIRLFSEMINEIANDHDVQVALSDVIFLNVQNIYQITEIFDRIDDETVIISDRPAFNMYEESFLYPDDILAIKLLKLQQALTRRQKRIDDMTGQGGGQ